MSENRERLIYASLTAMIVGVGLLVRWPPLGLPWPIAKYAGSTLWGAMVFMGMRAIWPRAAIHTTMIVAGLIAVGVEFSRLYQQPVLDAFRETLPGRLLLGRIFSLGNIVAYVAGIAGFALGDRWIARRARGPTAGT